MANKINVKTAAIPDLANIGPGQLRHLSDDQLREAVKRLNAAANGRLRSLAKNAPYAPALTTYGGERRGKFKTPNIADSRFNLMQAYREVRTFINAGTSTVTGAQQFAEKVRTGFADRGVDIGNANLSKLLKSLGRVTTDLGIVGKELKYRVAESISDILNRDPDTTEDELVQAMIADIDNIYRQQEERYADTFSGEWPINSSPRG